MTQSEMLDGADVAETTPSAGRYLMIAMLVVWALIVAAMALVAPPLMIVTLVFLALVIGVALLAGRGRGGTLVGLAFVAVAVMGLLFFLQDTLVDYPCDASGTDPRCGISHAPNP
jgi:hypothetical protein